MLKLFFGELLGTFFLILLGNGVVANALLKKTKGIAVGESWLLISWGWGMGVFVGVYTVASVTGAHINPAVTIGLALAGKFAWYKVPIYLAGQLAGAMIGAWFVYLAYLDHYAATKDAARVKLLTFCTNPEIRNFKTNFLTEVIATFVLILGVLYLAKPTVGLGAVSALPVGLLVFAIGLSLGGPTGYAINPARDLGPRIVHALLPIPGKGGSDWAYSWIPVLGPLVGAGLAALVYRLLPF